MTKYKADLYKNQKILEGYSHREIGILLAKTLYLKGLRPLALLNFLKTFISELSDQITYKVSESK